MEACYVISAEQYTDLATERGTGPSPVSGMVPVRGLGAVAKKKV